MHRIAGRRDVRAAAIAVIVVIVMLASTAALSAAFASQSTTSGGVTRTALAETAPANAPGQELYLQEVRIDPGAKLPTHFHEGTQVASIRAGVLTYDIVSGSTTVTRADGKVETITGPTTITLRKGDALVETTSLVHFGSNKGKKEVVVLLAALLAQGAPLATPVNGVQ